MKAAREALWRTPDTIYVHHNMTSYDNPVQFDPPVTDHEREVLIPYVRKDMSDARIADLEAQIAKLRRLDGEYGEVEEAIIMADPEFDGDSKHASPKERLIASIQRLAAKAKHNGS